MANNLGRPVDVDTPGATGATAERAGLEPGLAVTVKGIIDDAIELIRQQFAMLKAEIRSDFRKLIGAVIPLAAAIGPLLLGGLMGCFALVHLIHWATLPAGLQIEPAALPLWGAYAIVSAGCLLLGGTLVGIGYYRIKSFNPLPEQTAQALEENIQWLTNQTPK
jgi:Putative Actinobacterial Holin-X, holin superfamily III